MLKLRRINFSIIWMINTLSADDVLRRFYANVTPSLTNFPCLLAAGHCASVDIVLIVGMVAGFAYSL